MPSQSMQSQGEMYRGAAGVAPGVGTGIGALVGGLAGIPLGPAGITAGAGVGGAVGAGLGSMAGMGLEGMARGPEREYEQQMLQYQIEQERRATEQAQKDRALNMLLAMRPR